MRKSYKVIEDGIGHYWCWYFDDGGFQLHRINGPAVEYANGNKEWWLNDRRYSKKAYYTELLKRTLITKKEAFIEIL